MKLFLDDIRDPKECRSYMLSRIGVKCMKYEEGEWYIVRNFEQFKKAILLFHKHIEIISFDHDLAFEHYYDSAMKIEEENYNNPTGYECAKFFKEFFDENNLPYPELWVHSMNPVGTERIINLFK